MIVDKKLGAQQPVSSMQSGMEKLADVSSNMLKRDRLVISSNLARDNEWDS